MTRQTTGIVRAKDIPSGPPGLAGYCWLQDPKTGVHCCQPAGHPSHVQHSYPYVRPPIRWS